eukprot:CAMPEP_0119261556 /NCGR_PEP_ID=MMETSP1329-20130426/1584_1 /TAXON_ID=114041 /ORGANISM="Genus nov. species nov., Strain RCC1024" /LENGTH=198 /DNA_ID=CAMNT_0007261121 /DNA_START=193 /DNA_END=788 /DNA_ORIENTATION=-
MDLELILRIGCCGCFFGHGFIAAYKLEFGGWSKFMYAAGFREKEAHLIMPIIGWMDLVLAVQTLVYPLELCTAWMVVWAFSTALVRPFSAGWEKASSPLSSNALWGFVERAANWGCPLALLALQTEGDYLPAHLPLPHMCCVADAMEPLADVLSGYSRDFLWKFMGCAFALPWFVVIPLLKLRGAAGNDAGHVDALQD